MNTPNEHSKPNDNMQQLKQQASTCGSGCACHTTATPGKTRWVIGAVVLIAAGIMVVRGMVSSDGKKSQSTDTSYKNPAAPSATASESGPAKESVADASSSETSVGTTIGAFAELNTLAAKTDAVFVFLPAKGGASGNAPSTPMKGATRIMESKGIKCGLFTLKAGCPDYDQITAQMSVPGVLAVVKGRGMSAVSGEITESKLVQGYVAAANGGGCGPSASATCCPK